MFHYCNEESLVLESYPLESSFAWLCFASHHLSFSFPLLVARVEAAKLFKLYSGANRPLLQSGGEYLEKFKD